MAPALLYYISGHGFGHARRCAETIRVLNTRYPQLPVHIRTMADAGVFTGLSAIHEEVPIDRGAVERDALTIDWVATLAAVRELLAGQTSLVTSEAAFIRSHDIRLIIADVPFMAGYVGEAAGVPCWAQCNFTWDWIYEPHTDDAVLLELVRGGYRRMAGQLRLPFPHACDHFPVVRDVPFITSPLTRSRLEARARLGIAADERRPVVLIGMRGGTEPQTLARLRSAAQQYLFITPAGPVHAPPRPPLRFWDALQLCDAVVSKPGHGIVTDCAAMGVALLHPQRNGFREDPLIIAAGAKYFRERSIPLADYHSGNWAPHLDALLAQPRPAPASETHGAEFVADFVARKLSL